MWQTALSASATFTEELLENIYGFAGVKFLLVPVHDVIHRQCEAYRLTGTDYDFVIQTNCDDIARERELSAREDVLEGRAIQYYSDSYLESLAVCRKIAEVLPEYDSFLFHGSALAADGQAFLFAAPSGTGKSTHARLWRELLGERVVMVNDDKPIIRVNEHESAVYGTPWDGKHHLSSNIAVPLKAICFLEQAKRNSICEVSKREMLPALLRQVYLPEDPVMVRKTLELLDRMQVRFYQMKCNMELQAAEMAYQCMKGA